MLWQLVPFSSSSWCCLLAHASLPVPFPSCRLPLCLFLFPGAGSLSACSFSRGRSPLCLFLFPAPAPSLSVPFPGAGSLSVCSCSRRRLPLCLFLFPAPAPSLPVPFPRDRWSPRGANDDMFCATDFNFSLATWQVQFPPRQVRCSIVVSISACHAEDPGSIPGGGISFSWLECCSRRRRLDEVDGIRPNCPCSGKRATPHLDARLFLQMSTVGLSGRSPHTPK